MNKDMIVDVAQPELQDCKAFRVVGLSAACNFEDVSGIPGLWQAFNERINEVEGRSGEVTFGVCYDADEAGNFRYLAGAKSDAAARGMDLVEVPAGRYAVFTHKGHVSDLPKTVYTIWNKCLPDLGLTPTGAPDFERYDSRFDPTTGFGSVEVWIPVS